MALVHHAVRKMENRTWPITATPKTTVAISTASMMEARLGSDPMRHRWRRSSVGVDLRQTGQLRTLASVVPSPMRCPEPARQPQALASQGTEEFRETGVDQTRKK